MSLIHIQADFGSGFQDVNPRNLKDTKLEAIFTNDYPSASVQSILYELVGADAKAVNNYILANGVGEGIPLQITIGSTPVFVGVFDIANAAALYECDIVKLPIKKTGSIDWFMDTAEAVTFTLLHDAGIISPPAGDPGYNPSAKFFYKKTPYSLTFRDWEQALLLFLEGFSLAQHLYQAILETTNDITNIGGTATGAITVLGAPADVPVGIAEIVSIAADIVYDIALVIAVVGLAETIINQTVQVKKYKYCMTVNDIVNAGLYYINNNLGPKTPNLQFVSTIFQGTASKNRPTSGPYSGCYGNIYVNTTVMPKKNLKVKLGANFIATLKSGGPLTVGNEAYPGTIGPPYGYPDKNLKQFLQEQMQVFNASIKIIGNQVQFEEKHFWNNIAPFKLPNTANPGYNFNWPQPDSYNWHELSMSYLLRFLTDGGDECTLKFYKGTTCQVQMPPIKVRNVLNLLNPPSVDMLLPYALAKRKEEYNFAEQVVNDFINGINTIITVLLLPINIVITVINWIISLFSGSVNTIPTINISIPTLNRIGWMELSNDSFEEQKIFIGEQIGGDWLLISDYVPSGVTQYVNSDGQPENPMSAIALLQNFHGLNLMTRGNQWLLYKNKTFPMCSADFLALMNNNILIDAKGNLGKFEKILWKPSDDLAEGVDYRINFTYDKNHTEQITIDGN